VRTTVSELWRYPVKSLLGERLNEIEVGPRGFRGDRRFAVTDRDGKIGSGKTTRRFRLLPGLFDLRAHIEGEQALVTLPDGHELPVGDPRLDEFLSARYGDQPRVVEESTVPHHDAAPLHLLTTASLRWLAARLPDSVVDRRRFRPNILLDVVGNEVVEDSWVGQRFALGGTVVRIAERTERCVMTTNSQDELSRDPAILGAITKMNEVCLGAYATVERPGTIRVGDSLAKVD
jgi:MOSC domain-containing protein